MQTVTILYRVCYFGLKSSKHVLLFQLKRNVVSVDFHISKYAKIVEELKIEVCLNLLIKNLNFHADLLLNDLF